MATIIGSKGIAILFFSLVIGLFGYFIYFLVMGNTDPAYYWQNPAYRSGSTPLQPNAPVSQQVAQTIESRLILLRNESQTVGKLKITYLGIADGSLRFDVNILDLDPNFAYRYTVPLAHAKKRFRIAEQYFQAQATSQRKVRLIHIPLQ